MYNVDVAVFVPGQRFSGRSISSSIFIPPASFVPAVIAIHRRRREACPAAEGECLFSIIEHKAPRFMCMSKPCFGTYDLAVWHTGFGRQ